MNYLGRLKNKQGMFWCYREAGGLPGPEIQQVVKKFNGKFIKIRGFDEFMYELQWSNKFNYLFDEFEISPQEEQKNTEHNTRN